MDASMPRPHRLPGNKARHGGRLALSVAMLLVTSGCASVEPGRPGPLRGSSGSVTWEVSDIGRVVSSDNQRVRWSYLIVLKNPSDRVIQLERVERAITADSPEMVGGSPVPQPFRRTLAARAELHVPVSDNWGWMPRSNTTFGGVATLRPIMAFREFSGTDDQGTPVRIQVRVRLDPSVGRLAKPATMPKALPAAKTLESDRDLASLVGVWRGSYRLDGSLLDVPIEMAVLADGTGQVAENNPVTNRFRRAVRVKDGGLEYSGDRERGTLTLHETEGRRVLAGRISQIDGPPYALYLEDQGMTSANLNQPGGQCCATDAGAGGKGSAGSHRHAERRPWMPLDHRATAPVHPEPGPSGRRLAVSVAPLETRRETLVHVAEVADRLGYDAFLLPEAWSYDSTVLLTEAATWTRPIRLGTGVLSVWNRTPAAIAMAASALHDVSGGRFLLGLGASPSQLTEGFHDVPFRAPVRRLRRVWAVSHPGA